MRQLRLLRGAVAIAAMSAVLVAGASGSPGSRLTGDACAGRWRVVATGAKVPSLNEVAAISPTNVWAVGGSNEDAETAMPVIVHWDGKRLRSYRGFKPSGRYGELNAISAVAPDDVWAVGVDGQFRGRPVVMHWNGRAWKRTATPRVRGDARLNGIAAMSSSDVWAVGWDQNGALVMHWNGRAWSLVDLPSFVGPPPFVGSNTSLSAVDGSSPHDVWAVGGVGGENFGASFSLHWDGRSWKQMTALSPPCIECGDDVWQSAVDVRTPADVWTLQFSHHQMWSHPNTHQILRWDGRRQKIAYDYQGAGWLRDLAAVSATNVWFVGDANNSDPDIPLIGHWNGQSWRIQRTPLNSLRGTTLNDVFALSATEIWAAGNHLIARYSC